MTGATSSVTCFCIDKFLLFLICSTVLVVAAPRSKSKGRDESPQLVYDQKQTGDYNIQLHLKDFQIIALLGDDSLGDYDYNYDYADFTVKPPAGSSSTTTTAKPSTTARVTSTTTTTIRSTSTTANLPLSSNKFDSSPTIEPIVKKPLGTIIVPETPSLISHSNSSVISNVHPYPIEVVVFEPVKKPVEVEQIKIKETDKLKDESDLNSKDTAPETSANEIVNVSSSSSPLSSTDYLSSDASSTSPEPPKSSSAIPDSMTPGKIKVQILESPSPTMEVISTSVGIVPGEDVQSDVSGSVLHGELASYRKCASGFSRDKKGRCRRTRRPGVVPQLPFGFGRIASNLATRLRLPSQEGSAIAPVLTKR